MSTHRKKDEPAASEAAAAAAIAASSSAAAGAAARPRRDQIRPLTAGPVGRTVPSMPPLALTRVGKSMQPGRAGTVKLHHRFGAALLLVRYRYHWTGLYRYTTVELLVDAAPVTRGQSLSALYPVRLGPNEGKLVAEAQLHGARWNPMLLCWTLPGHVVQALDLGHRVESSPHGRRRARKAKRQEPNRLADIPTRGHL